MDALLLIILAVILAFKSDQEESAKPELEVRLNPDYIKEEEAFQVIFNALVKERNI